MLRAVRETQREENLKTVVARLFACAVLAYSPQLFAQAQSAPTGPVAKPATPTTSNLVSEPPSEPEPTAEAAAVEPEAETAEAASSDTDKHDVGASRLEGDLRKLEAERAEYSRFWPWFTLSTGAAMAVGGVAVGAGYVFGCDNGCSTPAWIGIIVAAGTLVATLGTIWVVNANADVREIDSHRYQLEQEIERIRVSAKLPNRSDSQASAPLVSWRFVLN
jgi:hypothetical protein